MVFAESHTPLFSKFAWSKVVITAKSFGFTQAGFSALMKLSRISCGSFIGCSFLRTKNNYACIAIPRLFFAEHARALTRSCSCLLVKSKAVMPCSCSMKLIKQTHLESVSKSSLGAVLGNNIFAYVRRYLLCTYCICNLCTTGVCNGQAETEPLHFYGQHYFYSQRATPQRSPRLLAFCVDR